MIRSTWFAASVLVGLALLVSVSTSWSAEHPWKDKTNSAPSVADRESVQLDTQAVTATPRPTTGVGVQLAYVSSSGSDTIAVIDTATDTIQKTMRIGSGIRPGQSIAISPDGTLAYVAGSKRIYVFSVPTTTLQRVIALDRDPQTLRITPDGAFLYATNRETSSILVIDATTEAVVGVIDGIAGATDIVFGLDGRTAYVIGPYSGLTVIDTASQQVAGTIPIDGYVGGVTIAPDGEHAYATSQNCPDGPNAVTDVRPIALSAPPTPPRTPRPCVLSVVVIDTRTNTVSSSIPLTFIPVAIAISPDGALLYVASQSGSITTISTTSNTVVASFFPTINPRRIVFAPDGAHAYVTGDGVAVIDTVTNVATQLPFSGPVGIALTADGTVAYLSTPDTLSVIATATNTVTSSITTHSPNDIALSADGAVAYVAADTVLVIDTASTEIVASIPVAATAIRLTPDNTSVYAAAGTQVVVIDTSSKSITTTVPLNGYAGQIAFSPDGAFAYVTTNATFGFSSITVINARTHTLAATLPRSAADVVFAPDGSRVYAPSGDLLLIGTAAGRVIRTITLPQARPPSRVALSADGRLAYLTSYTYPDLQTAEVLIVDTATGNLEDTVLLESPIAEVALAPDGSALYVGDANADLTISSISVVATSTRRVTTRIPIGEGVLHIAFAPGPGRAGSPTATETPTATSTPTSRTVARRQLAYVANYGDRPLTDSTVTVIDTATNTITGTIAVPGSAHALALTPDGRRLFVGSVFRDLWVVDTETSSVVATIEVSSIPWSIAVTPDGAFAYVANIQSAGQVSVIDTATDAITTTVRGRGNPTGLAINADGSLAYVTRLLPPNAPGTQDVDLVSAVDTATHKLVASVPVADGANGIAITPDGRRAYVTGRNSHLVSIIDTTQNIGAGVVDAGAEPFAVAVSPNGKLVYVTRLDRTPFGEGSVAVIDATTNAITATIPVGMRPADVAFTLDGAFAYVSNDFSDTLSVIDTATSTVVATIPAGNGPQGIAIGLAPEVSSPTILPTRTCTATPTITATPTPFKPLPTAQPSIVPVAPTSAASRTDGTGGSGGCAIASHRKAPANLLLLLPFIMVLRRRRRR